VVGKQRRNLVSVDDIIDNALSALDKLSGVFSDLDTENERLGARERRKGISRWSEGKQIICDEIKIISGWLNRSSSPAIFSGFVSIKLIHTIQVSVFDVTCTSS